VYLFQKLAVSATGCLQPRHSNQLSTMAMGTSVLSRRTKILIASIAFVIGIAAAWLIRESVLYERTDDERIDGKIMPLSARINRTYNGPMSWKGRLSMSAMVTTAYSGLSSAQSAVKSAQAEVAAAENTLRADVAVLKQVETNEAQPRLVEFVVAADQQVVLETQKDLVRAASHLRDAQTAPQQASLAKVRAEAADSQVLQCRAQSLSCYGNHLQKTH